MYFDSADLQLAALEHIYAWSESGDSPAIALGVTRRLLRGDKAVLLQLSTAGNDDRVIATSGTDSEFAAGLLAYRDTENNFIGHFRSWDQDNAYDAARLTYTSDLLLSNFYRAFMEPNEVLHSLAGVVKRSPTSCTILCIYRSANGLQFDQIDSTRLRELMPHWRRAMDLRSRLARLDQQSGIAHCILNHAPFAIMTVDSSGVVLYANHRAKIVSRHNDGLCIKDGRIIASTSLSTRKLLEELQHGERLQSSLTMPVPFPIERPSGAKPYQLMIMPIQTTGEAGLGTGGTFGIFIYDPSHRLPIDSAALKSLEGLTDSEARLCESLYETKNLGESAGQLNVSLSTAKTHLLNTFRKLGINSQAELMYYLAHMPKMSTERLQ